MTAITVQITGSSRTFKTSVAGVTFINSDGSNRQDILRALSVGESLQLRREPQNPHDKFAIAVCRSNGQQVGYVPGGDVRLAQHIDSGGRATARVVRITGGPNFLTALFKALRKPYGCVIEIEKSDPDWKAIAPFMDKSREIERLIEHASLSESKDRSASIEQYRLAIAQIRELDAAGPVASAWRRARYPVNRLSLLLEKSGDPEGALQAIATYESFEDTYGISASDQRSIASRKARLAKRLSQKKQL